MNRIVREHYPVSKLPDDLREAFAGHDEVTVTVEGEPSQEPPEADRATEGQFSRLRHLAVPHYKSIDEINAYVNGLRDEWDERDRLLRTEE